MRPNKQFKNPHVSSSPNLPPANKPIPSQLLSSASNQQALIQQRKQIEQTLNELHRLQSEIYELNVPENPHSTSPVKKQIKQLSYLYENMSKPKIKNNLNVLSTDIELALRIINKDWSEDTKLQPEITQQINPTNTLASNQIDLLGKTKTNPQNNTVSNGLSNNFRTTIKSQLKSVNNQQNSQDKAYRVGKQTLQQKFEELTHNPISLSFISKNQKNQYISTPQLYEFINYTQCQSFDPIESAYKMFLNQEGEFDLKIYNQINEILGLPKIKNINTFISAIYSSQNANDYGDKLTKNEQEHGKQKMQQFIKNKNNTMTAKITLQQFKRVLDLEI